MKTYEPPRVALAHLPTPVERLPRLEAHLEGPRLWIKRDDQTGLAFGGNKTRKLELLVADALEQGSRTLLTRGAPQSNHCRQTAAAAARFGLACQLVLAGEPPGEVGGNLLLDRLLGAEIIWTGSSDPDHVLGEAYETAKRSGRRPYLIPYGGSNALGASAYALAIGELAGMKPAFDRIVLASSSGGTQAGMLAGLAAYGLQIQVTGISVDPVRDELEACIGQLVEELASLPGLDIEGERLPIEVTDAYLGGGYAIVGEAEREAIGLFARYEGILVDPVYTGRAAAGLIDLIRHGEIGPQERVLFWHTGGTPALFAYPASRTTGGS